MAEASNSKQSSVEQLQDQLAQLTQVVATLVKNE